MSELSETLKSGGKLCVTSSNWYIQYYFPGPDLRYSGTFVRIDDDLIDDYMNAWKTNYDNYSKLKMLLPDDKEYEATGEMKMIIRVGGPFDGVCLQSYKMIVRTMEELEKIIDEYEYCKKRALELQQIVKAL